MKKKTIYMLILPVAVLVYIFSWFVISHPYRLFPSDDVIFMRSSFYFFPVFHLSFSGFKWIWMLFSGNILQSLLMFGILSNGITLLFLILIIFRLTKRTVPAVLGAILFATSSWPATYYFMASYTTFATALAMAILWCIIEAFFNEKKAKLLLLAAFLVSILYFFSSLSALLLIFLETLVALYLLAPVYPFVKKLKKLFLILFPVFIVLFLILYSPLPGMLSIRDHLRKINIVDEWLSNIYEFRNQYTHAYQYIGYTPPIPKLSFFKIGMYYTPLIFWSFMILSGLFIVIFAIKRKYTPQTKFIFSLLFIIYAHAAAMDVLPFTKLARTHFVIYPIIIISLAILIDYFWENYLKHFKRAYKQIITGILILIFSYAIYGNIAGIKEIIRVRKYPGDVLSALISNAKVYMLKNDSHAYFIGRWLDVPINLVDNLKEINKGKLKENKRKIVFIIGPHGKYSGRSVMDKSELPDFDFTSMNIKKPGNAAEIKLPYYAYFPSFLFEEGVVSEELYFDGGSPDYKSADKQLTAWIW